MKVDLYNGCKTVVVATKADMSQ